MKVDNIEGLIDFIYSEEYKVIESIGSLSNYSKDDIQFIKSEGDAEYFCSFCNDNRNGKLILISGAQFKKNIFEESNANLENNLPLIYEATCLQCKHKTILILYLKNGEIELITISDYYAGVGTLNTPEPVKFYLDQAHRAKSAGAISASAAMYRSALEWILYDQGYNGKMLGNKIDELEKDIKNDKGLQWTKQVKIEFLQAIKNVGNGSMHTNDGDLELQTKIDEETISVIDYVMNELLDIIYEEPLKREKNLELLKQKSLLFNK